MDTSETTEPPDDLDRLIREALTGLGINAEAADLARAVRRLNYGLPAEDEFSVVCAWLGNCRLVHKLDQQQSPVSSREAFQVPDLIAIFEGAGPCLIEVKASTQTKLSLKPSYYARLRAYADALGLPILIAWKHHSLWVLFDTEQLKVARTNYNITFSEAFRHNLMGMLAGDVSYQLYPGAALNFVFAKEELLETEKSDRGHTETWRMRVADAYLTDGTGSRRDDLHSETIQLLSTWPLVESEVHTEHTVEQKFFVGEETSQFAHQALVALLNWERLGDGDTNWRGLLRASPITNTISDFRVALRRALNEKLVRYVFEQMPVEIPKFIRLAPLATTTQPKREPS